MYKQEKCGDKMEKHHNIRSNESVKKRALILSGILISLLIFVTSTVSACTYAYAYVPNLGNYTLDSPAQLSSTTLHGSSALTGHAPLGYAPNGTVSVIDTSTNEIVANVSVGGFPVGIAVSSDGKTVYVTNLYSDTLSVINTAKNTVKATVKVGRYPFGVAVAGSYVYVTNSEDGTVSVISKYTNKVVSTLEVGKWPVGIVSSGRYLYVTNNDNDTVSVIDSATRKVTNTVKVGGYPIGIAVNSAGTKVYVACGYEDNGTISVIDTTKNNVTATVNVGGWPFGVAVNPAGTRVYVTNEEDGTVSVINTATNKVIATVKVGYEPLGISVTPDGKKIYVANGASGTVSVINAATNTVIDTMNVGLFPTAFGQFIGVKTGVKKVLPVAAFSASSVKGKAPLSVKFTDKSTGSPTSYCWNFGDKSATSSAKNPTHKYAKAGKYTVTLTVTNSDGSNTLKKTNYITVS
jgi:YVTN family beta-propeller protein